MCKSVLLFVVGLVICLSLSTPAVTYGGGSGTADDPYQIWTPAQMNSIGANSTDWSKCFKLMADIDMSAYTGTQYHVIGNLTIRFTGTFDGNRHVIQNLTYTNLTYPGGSKIVGLFGYIENATILNLGVENVSLTTAGYIMGGLVGENANGTIAGCHATGSVSGLGDIGGLVGTNTGVISNCYSISVIGTAADAGGLVGDNHGTIADCFSMGTVNGTQSSVGGLAGYNSHGSIVSCFSTCSVNGASYVGGLIGDNFIGTVSNCYSTGKTSGSKYIGGLVGYSELGNISLCYSAGSVIGTSYVGGLVGERIQGTVNNSFWDVQTSGQTSSDGGTGKTTAEMQMLSTFTAALWDFSPALTDGDRQDWVLLSEGMEYPKLRFQMPFLYHGGDGTIDNPYQLADANDIQTLADDGGDWDKSFVLIKDIDLGGVIFNTSIIAPDTNSSRSDIQRAFTGIFDGNNYKITNFTIDSSNQYLGFIGRIGFMGQIKNLGLENFIIIGLKDIGGLSGINEGNIVGCYTSDFTVSGQERAGGLTGDNSSGVISNSRSSGYVCSSYYSGGLAGSNNGDIHSCYSICRVSGYGYTGGLTGTNENNISNCYSDSSISGNQYAGGLVGVNEGTLTSCYASGSVSGVSDIGGLCGFQYEDPAIIQNCFWDTQASGQSTSAGGIGLSTYQMQKRVTYLLYGWDFVGEAGNGTEDIWTLCEGMNYPKLVWQVPAADWFCPDGVGPDELLYFSYYWLADNCASQENCDGVDLNYSGKVDLADFAEFAGQWLEGI